MQRKPKRCRICREQFSPFSTLSKVCSPRCAINLVEKEKAKEVRKAERAQKQQTLQWRRENMTKGELTAAAQKAFNRFIRLRDHAQPCISCGKHEAGGGWDAGHYKTVGAFPELRFEEANVHKQCKHCNKWLGGNYANYRLLLPGRIGQDKFDWLEGPHELKTYSRQDLRDIADHYRKAANQLQKIIDTTWSTE
jgi:hypothetical protein